MAIDIASNTSKIASYQPTSTPLPPWSCLPAEISSSDFVKLFGEQKLTSPSWQKFTAQPRELQLEICQQSIQALHCDIEQKAVLLVNTVAYIKDAGLWQAGNGGDISWWTWVRDSNLLWDIRAVCKQLYDSKNHLVSRKLMHIL
jgi:hypothetical protein